MVQLGSAGYDDLMDETPPDEADPRDAGLREAVRALVESVTATSRLFSDAADAFASETTRVLEGFADRIEDSAVQTRDMAGLAGRAADEARRVSEGVEAKVAAAAEGVRAELETLLNEARAQLEEALKASSDAVAAVRQAAEEAQQRTQEASDLAGQSAASSRNAATAAENAAEAARMTADTIEAATAEAREVILAESARIDSESATRFEQSLAESREAAAAAERAADDARQSALEAMTYASEARVAPAAAEVPGAQELLDRLEADYELLTSLVANLHSGIAGLESAPATTSDSSDYSPEGAGRGVWADDETAIKDETPATWSAVPAPEPNDAPASTTALEDTDDAWTTGSSEPEDISGSAWTAPVFQPEAEPALSALSATPVYDLEAEPAGWGYNPVEDTKPAQAEGPWSGPDDAAILEPAAVSSEPDEDAGAPAQLMSLEPPATEALAATAAAERAGDLWHGWQPASTPPAYEPEAPAPADYSAPVWTPAAAETAATIDAGAEDSPEGGAPITAAGAWDWDAAPNPEPAPVAESAWLATTQSGTSRPSDREKVEPDGPAAAEIEAPGREDPEKPLVGGRLILHISPVPDFDRLLSLDGALGRLSFVHNVTLADYAREEVTFRVELGEGTNAEAFTSELSQMSGQSLEVTASEPGQLSLHILSHGI